MAERKFDPDAVARYRDFLLYWLEDVLEAEGGPIDTIKTGALKKAPAFGTTSEGLNAAQTYGISHSTVWGNLQALRQSLFGLVQALNAALEGYETSENYTVDDFKTQYSEMDSANLLPANEAGSATESTATTEDYSDALG